MLVPFEVKTSKLSKSFMKRIFQSPLTTLLPASFTLALGPGAQNRGCKRMYRPGQPSYQNYRQYGRSVDALIQRYARQKNMSETCRRWRNTPAMVRRGPDDLPFTFMSYNILAQDLLEMHEDLYDQHDAVTLSWSHRYDRLMSEINFIRPDILCLQELQEDHKEQFSSGLANFNYDIIYKKRTGEKTDGCAIYYRRDLFELLDKQEVEYYQPNVKRLDRENVAIIAKLGVKSNPTQRLVVATTHLLYNPRRQDIRLAQIQVLLAELDRLSFIGRYENGTPKYAPTIVSGDFNLQPYTAPYVLITTGFLQYETLTTNTLEPNRHANESAFGKELLPSKLEITDDCRHACLLGREELDSTTRTKLHHSSGVPPTPPTSPGDQKLNDSFCQGILRHRFKFASAYRHNIGEDNQEASTFQGKWITVDYLFYTKFDSSNERPFRESNLKLVDTYSLPTVRQSKEILTIPNMYFGSDHFALAGRFLLKADSDPNL